MFRHAKVFAPLALALSGAATAAPDLPIPATSASTLDWLLAGRQPVADAMGVSLWVSRDGTYELSLRDSGVLDLKPLAPLPRAETPGLLRRDLLLGFPVSDSLRFGLSAGVEYAAMPCLSGMASLACLDRSDRAPDSGARLGAALAGDGWQLDLSYARRGTGGALPGLTIVPSEPGLLAAPILPAGDGATRWRGEELGLRGRFGASGWVLGLHVEQWRLAPGPWASHLLELEHESAAFTLGLSRGALSGTLSSRIVHSDPFGHSQFWGGLDLGLSWRMPWHAEIQFGARNLLTREVQPAPAGAGSDEFRARTPYVRYHQDF